MNKDSEKKIQKVKGPDDIKVLTILLNQVCNFSCAYCYSAKGRSKTILQEETLKTALDFFIRKERGDNLQIVFSGGGDPMVSFDRFRMAVDYAFYKAHKEELKLDIDVVTNGSLLDNQAIDYIKEKGIGLVVSFDVLKDVHDTQRSHYDIVASTISKLIENRIGFGIRCTVTPLNVNRLCETIEELHKRFSNIKCIALEAVINKELFSGTDKLREFYDSFIENFTAAKKIGKQYGIDVGNTEYMNAAAFQERSCLGKFVLTPEGNLTACSRISSSNEDFHDDFLYGKVCADSIVIDYDRYNNIMEEADAYLPECKDCMARWHCGGGCLLARKTYSKEYFKEHCRFICRITEIAQNDNELD